MSSIRISLHGAAGEVTGSCTLVETPTARVVIDFGLYQGTPENEAKNHVMPAIDFARVDAIIVTHAHVDHCGRLGLLPALGFDGAVFASEPTVHVLPFILRSSASLQALRVDESREGTAPRCAVLEPEALRWNSRLRHEEPKILFGHRAAGQVARELIALPWREWDEVAPGVRARLHHASHMLGAASVELECDIPGGTPRRILFSGDLGAADSPVLATYGFPDAPVDVVVMESTNGAQYATERKAKQFDDGLATLRAVVKRARATNGRVLVPSFAIGRSQLLVHALGELSREGALGDMPVFLDSSMAVRACNLMGRWPHLLAAPLQRARLAGRDALGFPQLRLLRSREESGVIDGTRSACVIIAGSGFCDAGPILRHLARAIERESSTILFAGHVLHDTLGWGLRHGATRVAINDEAFDVKAQTTVATGFSGHASPAELLAWLERVPGTGKVLLNHGSDAGRSGMVEALRLSGRTDVVAPAACEVVAV